MIFYITRISSIAFIIMALSSCSTYSTKFACGDGKGLPCTMLRSVDKQIDSGEIDKAYKDKCKGIICKNRSELYQDLLEQPKGEVIRAKFKELEEINDVIIEGSNPEEKGSVQNNNKGQL